MQNFKFTLICYPEYIIIQRNSFFLCLRDEIKIPMKLCNIFEKLNNINKEINNLSLMSSFKQKQIINNANYDIKSIYKNIKIFDKIKEKIEKLIVKCSKNGKHEVMIRFKYNKFKVLNGKFLNEYFKYIFDELKNNSIKIDVIEAYRGRKNFTFEKTYGYFNVTKSINYYCIYNFSRENLKRLKYTDEINCDSNKYNYLNINLCWN